MSVDKENPLEIDAGLLTVTDLNPIDEEAYKYVFLIFIYVLIKTNDIRSDDLEEHLLSLARDGAQALFAALFSLPTSSSPDGPLANLPPPKTQLPRAKALPKPKPPTKWEQFANAKGIQHKKRDKKVWDEEKQDWVNRWGRDGKNRELEEQWITEVPHNAGTPSLLYFRKQMGTPTYSRRQTLISILGRQPEMNARDVLLRTKSNGWPMWLGPLPLTVERDVRRNWTARWPPPGSVPLAWESSTVHWMGRRSHEE